MKTKITTTTNYQRNSAFSQKHEKFTIRRTLTTISGKITKIRATTKTAINTSCKCF